MQYSWQYDEWPNFSYKELRLQKKLLEFGDKFGYASGLLKGLGDDLRIETIIDVLAQEALKTSEIEGEYLNREDVYSSIKRNLGLTPSKPNVSDNRAKGIAELILLIRNTYNKPLSKAMLLTWHRILMQGNSKIKAGKWRSHKEPMHVVSGSIGKEIIHFEAPPSDVVPREMERFITWFNDSAPGNKSAIENPLVRSAIAHVYFETIHPFEDGNGRIGRFISEKALSQGLGMPVILSLSKVIDQNKKQYYNALKSAQRTLDWTEWIRYFINVILTAQNDALKQIEFTLTKVRFLEKYENKINNRQRKVINKMFNAGKEGFEGGMNTKKYISITRASKATATRDLQGLFEMNIFNRKGGGRSIHYELNI
jgi:Fic family protein